MKGRILLVPLQDAGGGTGHMRRCRAVARHLGERAALWTADTQREPWDLVVLDRRRTSAEELERLAPGSPIVALDDGGDARRLAAYTLDVIPGGSLGGIAPNLDAPWLLELPEPGPAKSASGIGSILVSFGGEDPYRLTERFLTVLAEMDLYRTHRVTVVEGPAFGRTISAPGARLLLAPEELAGPMREHDLVVTSYGLTAFEALAAGIPVLLANPTPYHERLGRRARLPSLGTGALAPAALASWLGRPADLARPVGEYRTTLRRDLGPEARGYRGLAALLTRLADALPEPRGLAGRCPVCGARHPATHRMEDRTYFRCPETSLRYAVPFPERRRVYTQSYFFEEYRAQYGKTYLEDFEVIRAASRSRLAILARLVKAPGPIVDIGCAYGPFLAACRDAGYVAAGLDVAEDAVAHVRTVLRLEAWVEDFATGALEGVRRLAPRALTLWYVIEHFVDLAGVLARANELLPLGGALAFSTPSGGGISARTDLGRFLERSPRDHYTIWSPARAARVLGRYGFRVRRVRVTGHHPERSGLLGRLGPLGGLCSRILGLGDTFEVYAVKTREARREHG